MPGMAEVETTRAGAVLTVTLNRPEVLNAFNAAMHKALAAALKEAADAEVRAVVLTGAGRGFCVGQDLTEFREAAGDIGARLRGQYHPSVLAVRRLEKPVIAAVNGAAAGAGLSIACACDLRIAAASASFVPAFINVGLIPDSGGSYFVTRLLGYARAFEWMTSGRKLSAAEAHAWGLVSEVVEDADLAARTADLAGQLAAMPTRGVGMTKRLFDRAATSAQSSASAIRSSVSILGGRPPDSRRAIADWVVPVSSASSFWESPCARRWSATCSATRAKNQPWSGSTCASRSRRRSKVSGGISHLCYYSTHEIQTSSRARLLRPHDVVHLWRDGRWAGRFVAAPVPRRRAACAWLRHRPPAGATPPAPFGCDCSAGRLSGDNPGQRRAVSGLVRRRVLPGVRAPAGADRGDHPAACEASNARISGCSGKRPSCCFEKMSSPSTRTSNWPFPPASISAS